MFWHTSWMYGRVPTFKGGPLPIHSTIAEPATNYCPKWRESSAGLMRDVIDLASAEMLLGRSNRRR